MKQNFLNILRNRLSNRFEFRRSTKSLAFILAKNVVRHLEYKATRESIILDLKKKIFFIPVLRAGLSLLEPFIEIFKRFETKVGLISLK